MQGWHDVAQLILQILSPARSGISSICSLIGIPLAINLSRRLLKFSFHLGRLKNELIINQI